MNKFLFEYSSNKLNASRRLRPCFKLLFILLIIFLIIFSFFQISFSLNFIGNESVLENLNKLFKFENQDLRFPSNTILENSLNYLWITIRLTLTGTVIGFFLALITSFLCSKKITNNYLSILLKLFILFLRSFPAIIFINISKSVFHLELAAILIFAWFSWIWCNKYLSEIISNVDVQPYKWSLKNGLGRFYSFKNQIYLRCKNKFIGIFLYSFESNFRWTTLLATVGVIGIGFFIEQNIPNNFELIGIPLVLILISLLFLEFLSLFIKKILLVNKSKLKKTFNWKKIINYLILFLILSIVIYSLIILNFEEFNKKILSQKIYSLFKPDFSLWTKNESRQNPWLGILELFYQCVCAIFIASIYSFFMSILTSEKIQKSYVYVPAKILNTFLRIFPIIILFYIFNPLFFNAISLGIILFGLYSGTIISKQLSESINTLEKETIIFYKKQGYSKIFIIKIYVWPKIKKDFKSFAYIRLEVIFRGMIILGGLGFSILGARLESFELRNQLEYTSAFMWPILITIFTYNIIPNIIKILKRKTIWKK